MLNIPQNNFKYRGGEFAIFVYFFVFNSINYIKDNYNFF